MNLSLISNLYISPLAHLAIVLDLLLQRLCPVQVAHDNAAVGQPHLESRALGGHLAGAGAEPWYGQRPDALGRAVAHGAIVGPGPQKDRAHAQVGVDSAAYGGRDAHRRRDHHIAEAASAGL